METKEKETELVQLVRQLRDYVIGTGYTPNIDPDKEEHNLPETEKYFYRLTKSNN